MSKLCVAGSKPQMRLSINKLKKMQSKKRKVKSYLDFALSEANILNRKKLKIQSAERNVTDGETLLDNTRDPKNQLKDKKEQEPELYLVEAGIQAKIFSSMPSQSPLLLKDFQHLILSACLQIYSPVKPCWCRLLRTRKISHTIVISVEGLTSTDFLNYKHDFKYVCETFHDFLEITPATSFFEDISHFLTIHSISELHNIIPDVPHCNEGKDDLITFSNTKDNFPRTQLLLSAAQMIQEDYPLPLSSVKESNYTWSRPFYEKVTDKSPMFAIDCEMCLTDKNKNEVTRISVVDENHNVLLDTFVKPENEIVDYLTKYSGVTEEMLQNVNTNLENVKKQVASILPPDAILCGQSLNFDLHALNLFHPYVIDTSVIFNLSGLRHRKSSLKNLSLAFLKEKIQNDPDGHCSIEDCIATLKLVQLKLQNGLQFGDSVFDQCTEQVPKTSQGLFPLLLSRQKDICVIGESATLNKCSEQLLPTEVKRIVKETNEDIVKCTVEEAINHNLTFCQLNFNHNLRATNFVRFLDESISALHTAAAINALVVIVFNGCAERKGNGLLMARIKNTNYQ